LRLAINEENCSGCRTCEMVCALENFRENNVKKARIRITGEFPDPGRYHIAYCDQCGTCAEICPQEAIKQHEDGYYWIDAELCSGCLICVDECPQGAIFTHPTEDTPFKCTLCGACITYCPRNAIYDADDPEKTAFKEFKEVG